ncbi:hypothetical protein OK016_19165 [Vibrio chagasii]|nr:hypothetical protein [Vibrio chagasii]
MLPQVGQFGLMTVEGVNSTESIQQNPMKGKTYWFLSANNGSIKTKASQS